jgi:hypothetical protein
LRQTAGGGAPGEMPFQEGPARFFVYLGHCTGAILFFLRLEALKKERTKEKNIRKNKAFISVITSY